jgi:branched-chain amino acid transport system permease protein
MTQVANLKLTQRAYKAGQAGGDAVHALALLLVGLAVMWVFPDDLALLTRANSTALLALSLWLIMGLTGIGSLGQAALSGCGGYAAGLFALHVSPDPLLGLFAGCTAGAVVALASGAFLLRTKGLALLMLTVAVAQLLYEIANKWRDVTGGDDGLSGYVMSPLLGRFSFDMIGNTGYVYSLVVLAVSFFLIRKVTRSPFGLTCRGIKSDAQRMVLLGTPVYRHRLTVYVMAGCFAGMSGAISAQVTGVVGLSGIEFTYSAEVLVMLVVGGMSGSWGGVLGAFGYIAAQDALSTANPFHWLLVLGMLLVLMVLYLPNGLLGMIQGVASRIWSRRDNE